MGKDNIVFHSEIWPAMLLGYSGQGARGGKPGPLGALNLPSEVVSSEYLTMEGRKFSSSRSVVIYVRDFLARYDVDALRYYVAVAGPENQDTDFTWSEFIRRNNDELVANWGNLVNRSVSFAARNIGVDPGRRAQLTDADAAILARSRDGVRDGRRVAGPVPVQGGDHRGHAHARRRPTSTCPTRRRGSCASPTRSGCGRSATWPCSWSDDGKTLLTPFLPESSQKVYEMLGGTGHVVRHAPDRARSARTAARTTR